GVGVVVGLAVRRKEVGGGQHVDDDASECIEVEWPAHRKRARQIAMADKYCILAGECGIAEHVIRMGMGVDHVTDRLCGDGADRGEQPPSLAHATTGVDYGD